MMRLDRILHPTVDEIERIFWRMEADRLDDLFDRHSTEIIESENLTRSDFPAVLALLQSRIRRRQLRSQIFSQHSVKM